MAKSNALVSEIVTHYVLCLGGMMMLYSKTVLVVMKAKKNILTTFCDQNFIANF